MVCFLNNILQLFICFNFIGRSSAEVKRATIVGNPMFSATERDEEPADLAGLDGLQLDMDYDQIMHYFENLKVRILLKNS